jgi:hypothetical protein
MCFPIPRSMGRNSSLDLKQSEGEKRAADDAEESSSLVEQLPGLAQGLKDQIDGPPGIRGSGGHSAKQFSHEPFAALKESRDQTARS